MNYLLLILTTYYSESSDEPETYTYFFPIDVQNQEYKDFLDLLRSASGDYHNFEPYSQYIPPVVQSLFNVQDETNQVNENLDEYERKAPVTLGQDNIKEVVYIKYDMG